MINPIQQQFGKKIAQLRSDRGWSQAELAKRSGLHFTYIGGIERGERNLSLQNIHKIAQAFGVPVWSLFVNQTLAQSEEAIRTGVLKGIRKDLERIQELLKGLK